MPIVRRACRPAPPPPPSSTRWSPRSAPCSPLERQIPCRREGGRTGIVHPRFRLHVHRAGGVVKIRMPGLYDGAGMARRCFCPPDRLTPRSSICVSCPSGRPATNRGRRHAGHLLNLGIRGVGLPPYVVGHRARQHGLLRHDCYASPGERLHARRTSRLQRHGTRSGIVKARQSWPRWIFRRPWRRDGDHAARLYGRSSSRQAHPSAVVAEGHAECQRRWQRPEDPQPLVFRNRGRSSSISFTRLATQGRWPGGRTAGHQHQGMGRHHVLAKRWSARTTRPPPLDPPSHITSTYPRSPAFDGRRHGRHELHGATGAFHQPLVGCPNAPLHGAFSQRPCARPLCFPAGWCSACPAFCTPRNTGSCAR